MLVGQAIWGLALACVFAKIDGANLVAFPVPILGWALIWGDGPGRIKLVESLEFNVIFGLCFYGLLGAGVAEIIWRFRRRRSY
jgi:hypothetical protein